MKTQLIHKQKDPMCHLSHLKIKTIGFSYTSNCCYLCEHCSNYSSPKRTEKLDPSIVAERIDEAASLGISLIAFTGGECMMYLEEILPLVSRAHNNGQTIAITTNGYWGKTREKAISIVQRLKEAGLNRLDISYGEFYERAGAKAEQVRNIIDECRNVDIEVKVPMVRKESPDEISSKAERECILNGFDVVPSIMVPYGRAGINFPPSENYYRRYSLDSFPRCTGIGHILYHSNGDLYPCCGQGIDEATKDGDARHLILGNIYSETLKESLEKCADNLFLQIMAIMGPGGFEILNRECPGVELPEEIIYPCDICILSAKNSKFKEWLSLLESNREEIRERIYKCYEVLNRWGITPYKYV